MALTVNQHEIQHMNEIAKKLGCEFRFDPVLNKRIDGKKYSDPVTYRISPDDVVRLDMESPERFDAYQEFCKRTGDQMIRSNKLILCGAGRSSLHITPEGTVLPCSMLMNAGVSVREKPLKEIWEIHFQEILDMERDFKLVCDSCTLHTVCDQCLGWSFVEYGIINKHVEYLCDIMKMRASSFPFLKRNEVNA